MSNTDQNHTKYLKSLNHITKKNMVAMKKAAMVDTVDTNLVRPAPQAKDYPVATKVTDGIKLDHIEPF